MRVLVLGGPHDGEVIDLPGGARELVLPVLAPAEYIAESAPGPTAMSLPVVVLSIAWRWVYEARGPALQRVAVWRG